MRYLLFIILAFSFSNTNAQVDTTNLQAMTQEFVDAYVGRDFQKLANLTHPNVIKLSGSMEFVRRDYQDDYNSLANMGFKYESGSVGTPGEIFQSGSEYLCFIPQLFIVELSGIRYLSEVYVLATTMTNGKVWSFVTLDRQDQESISTFIPSYEKRMGWPERTDLKELGN